MTNSTNASSCYPQPPGGPCLPGYIAEAGGLCCDGRDAHVKYRTPRDFGFETVFATSQVAPSATSNCGCLKTVPGAGLGCDMGHYAGAGHSPEDVPGLECDQTWHTLPDGTWAPYLAVTEVRVRFVAATK